MNLQQVKLDQKTAEGVYKKYLTWLYKLVVLEGRRFDLVLGAANSGIFMVESAKMLFAAVDVSQPKFLVLPIQRYTVPGQDEGEHFDNSVHTSFAREELQGLKKLENVLFVDDEVGKAFTAKESIGLVLKAVPELVPQRLLYTILAENHAFEWRYDLPPVAVQYYAFGNKIKRYERGESVEDEKVLHVNGSVFYILNEDILKKYQGVEYFYKENERQEITEKHLAALFTDGRLKTNIAGVPSLTMEVLEKARLVKDFNQDRANFLVYVRGLIADVTENYSKYLENGVFKD